MVIQFLHNKSEYNTINKDTELIVEKTITLKNDCDLVNPYVVLKLDDVLFLSNYAYIPKFKRYYFITGIEILSKTLVAVSMHVDVLESFKSDILAGTVHITESSDSNTNSYYPKELDSLTSMESHKFISNKELALNPSKVLATLGGV